VLLMGQLENEIRSTIYSKSLVPKLGAMRRFLELNGFKPVQNPSTSDLEGKVIALPNGTREYDIFFFDVKSAKQEPNGFSIEGGDNLVFLALEFLNTIQFRTNIANLGVELFLPYYLFMNEELRFEGLPEPISQFLYIGDNISNIPDGITRLEPQIGYRAPPKRKVTALEIERANPALLARINRRIKTMSLGDEVLEYDLQSVIGNLPIEIRTKEAGGVYSRMFSRGKNLSTVTDINGARVIAGSPDECYQILKKVFYEFIAPKREYAHMPLYTLDRIAIPRANGFQMLCLTGYHKGKLIEVQIQTPKMRHNAEFGLASNYRLK